MSCVEVPPNTVQTLSLPFQSSPALLDPVEHVLILLVRLLGFFDRLFDGLFSLRVLARFASRPFAQLPDSIR